MGYWIEHFKCGCNVIRPDGRFERITLSLGEDCPENDPTHPARAKAIEWAKERDDKNAAAVAKGLETRRKNKEAKDAQKQ